MNPSPLQFRAPTSPGRSSVGCPSPEPWSVRVGLTDDLHLVARVQAEAYLYLDVRGEAARRLTALCEPGAALFVLEGAHRSPLAFAVRRGQAACPGSVVSVAALIPLTPGMFVRAASRLLRCAETVRGEAGGGRLVVDFPELILGRGRSPSADREDVPDSTLASTRLPDWPGAFTAAPLATPWSDPEEDHAFAPYRTV
ncbi:hypothetical protein [Deinococcus alpinitundrae]|uniref:hypothetical protein n=1 Tax=Deinococcus alpinitundrae TaxID=468913 RepID=UPI00137AD419|nr:hypothetical protein [Deinococcus alpinitundrae]